MELWKVTAYLAAFFFGLYNVFTKLAAGKISDSLGALVLELTAVLMILGYLIFLMVSGEKPFDLTKKGIIFSALGGISVAFCSILYFSVFRLGGNLSAAGSVIVIGGIVVMAMIGTIVLGEKLTTSHFLGLGFGLISLYLLSR